MKSVSFVTGNPGKVESLQNILQDTGLDIRVEMLEADYPEDKSKGTVQWVALQGAQYCASEHNVPVLVTDTGIFIAALNGFPGINTAFALDTIGNEGIIRLMKGEEDRSVTWELSLGYCEPNGDPVEFTAKIPGVIADTVYDGGFGFDPIFIPKGHTSTLAEDVSLRDTVSPFRVAVEQFAQFLGGVK